MFFDLGRAAANEIAQNLGPERSMPRDLKRQASTAISGDLIKLPFLP